MGKQEDMQEMIETIYDLVVDMDYGQVENVYTYALDEHEEPNHEAVALQAVIDLSKKYKADKTMAKRRKTIDEYERNGNGFVVKKRHKYEYDETATVCQNVSRLLNKKEFGLFCWGLSYDLDESHYVVALDNHERIIGVFNDAVGDFTSVTPDKKAIFRFLLTVNADSYILVHNHPADVGEDEEEFLGLLQRSDNDKSVDIDFHLIGNALGIPMYDSLVLVYGRFYSAKHDIIGE